MSVSDVCVQYVQGTDHRNIWTFGTCNTVTIKRCIWIL